MQNENQPVIKNIERWMYLGLGLIIMLCLGTVYSWSVFRGAVEKHYQIGTFLSGLPYMISLAMYAFFMFLAGRYLDKYNPAKIMILGGTLVSVGWLLSGFAKGIGVLTITYGLFIGAGIGIIYGVPMMLIAKLFPEKKGLAVGIVLAGFGVSPLVTAPLARKLMLEFELLMTFRILGVAFLFILPLFSLPFGRKKLYDFLQYEMVQEIAVNGEEIDTTKMIRTRNFKGLFLNFIIGTMIGLMLIGITSGIGTDYMKLEPKRVAFMVSVFALFNGLGRPIFGWLTDKIYPKGAMMLSYFLILIATTLMLLAKEGNGIIFLIAFSIFWFNLGAWLAIAPTSTLYMFGKNHYSQNFGVVFTAYGLGAVLGVTISGVMIDLFGGFNMVFYFVIFLCLLGMLVSYKLVEV